MDILGFPNVDEQILNCISEDWKSVFEISSELDVGVTRVNKRINQLKKWDQISYMFGEKERHKRGKIPMVFKRK